MKHHLLRILFTLSVFLTITISAFGQADVSSAAVKGTVTDPTGAAVVGAVVSVKDLDQGAIRTATTDSNGEFQVRLVRPGNHQITVEARGFSQYLIKEVQLTVGQTATYEIKLEVAGFKTEVVVTASSPLIEVERTQQSNTIEQRQVESLPNINRNMTAAVYTLPAVTNSEATRTQQPGFTGFGTTGYSIGAATGVTTSPRLTGARMNTVRGSTGCSSLLIPSRSTRLTGTASPRSLDSRWGAPSTSSPRVAATSIMGAPTATSETTPLRRLTTLTRSKPN